MSTRMLLISVELTKFTMKLAVSALLVSSVAGFNMDMTFSLGKKKAASKAKVSQFL